MKLGLWTAAVSLVGASWMFACSSDPNAAPAPANDGGPTEEGGPKDGGTKPEAGGDAAVEGGLPNLKLKDGGVIFIGVTTGASPHAAYYIQTGEDIYDLEAVPVAGGAPIVLKANIAIDDVGYVKGGAIGWYTGTDPATFIATSISVWTPANGIKTVTTPTMDGLFEASADGVYVSFGADSTETSTDIVVTTSASPSAASPALTGANALNLAAAFADCPPQLGFAGTTYVGAYCTGTDDTATAARLVTVSAGGAAVVRVDEAVDTIQSSYQADSTGTKLVVLTPDPENKARLVLTNDAATTLVDADPGVQSSKILTDGSAVIYRTADGAIKTATFATPTVITPIVATGALGFIDFSPDAKKVLYYTQLNVADNVNDLNLVDVTAMTPTPVVFVATQTAGSAGFTGTGSHVAFLEGFTGQTAKLKSKPVAGGAEIVLDNASYLQFFAPSGNGLLSVTAIASLGQGAVSMTLKYTDGAQGGELKSAASDVLFVQQGDAFAWTGKTFVYTSVNATAPGLYALTVP